MIKKLFRQKTMSWVSRYILRIFLHTCIAIVVALIFYIYKGSSFKGADSHVYNLQNEDSELSYSDSGLFNGSLKNNLINVVELSAYQSRF